MARAALGMQPSHQQSHLIVNGLPGQGRQLRNYGSVNQPQIEPSDASGWRGTQVRAVNRGRGCGDDIGEGATGVRPPPQRWRCRVVAAPQHLHSSARVAREQGGQCGVDVL